MMDVAIAQKRPPVPRRKRAGQDPAKRRQIIEGAYRVFLEQGFDAASMNDITREAGVSKGTIYVYFDNKLDLFEALIEDERQAYTAGLAGLLSPDAEPVEALTAYGLAMLKLVTRRDVVRAQRAVIAMSERLPDLGRRFHQAGPEHTRALVARYLEQAQLTSGPAARDPKLAAQLFVDMCAGHSSRERLYGKEEDGISDKEARRIVSMAVGMVLGATSARA
jgi:AcrR family transcriptional regulator